MHSGNHCSAPQSPAARWIGQVRSLQGQLWVKMPSRYGKKTAGSGTKQTTCMAYWVVLACRPMSQNSFHCGQNGNNDAYFTVITGFCERTRLVLRSASSGPPLGAASPCGLPVLSAPLLPAPSTQVCHLCLFLGGLRAACLTPITAISWGP